MISKANEVIFEAKKLMRHSRRRNLTPKDIENALKFYVMGQTGQDIPEKEGNEQSLPLSHTLSPIHSKVEIEWVNL